MFDLMVACHEISSDDVARVRHSVATAPAAADTAAAAVPAADTAAAAVPVADTAAAAVRPAGLQGELAVAEPSSGSAVADSLPENALIMKALVWATKLNDNALLRGLAGSLPEAVLEEQIRLYQANKDIVKHDKPESLLVHAHLLSSRMQAAAAFDKYLKDGGLGARRAGSTQCMPRVHQGYDGVVTKTHS